jgi:hypothetical protein
VTAIGTDRNIQADAHNAILQALATLGIFGFIAAIFLLDQARRRLSGFFYDQRAAVMAGIVALLVNVMVNPVSLEALVLAGVLLGYVSMRRGHEEATPLPPILRPFVLLFAVLFATAISVLALADFHAGRPDLLSMQTAVKLAPYELSYKSKLIQASIFEINRTKDHELRAAILRVARREALLGVKLRPNNATAWYIAGVEAGMERDLGLRGARELPCLWRARELDPYFGPIHESIVMAR